MKRSTITARAVRPRVTKRTNDNYAVENNGKNNGHRDKYGRFSKGNRFGFQPGQSGNPGGRPKSHKDLEKFIQEIFNEPIEGKEDMTRLKLMLRGMATSKSAADHVAALEHGWGKVPQQVDIHDWRDEARQQGYDPDQLYRDMVNAARRRLVEQSGGGSVGGSAEADRGEDETA